MESRLFKNDLLTGHEPSIPGGETPPSTAGGTPAATDERFKGRCVGRPPAWAFFFMIMAVAVALVGGPSPTRGAVEVLVTLEAPLPALVIFTNAASWTRISETNSAGGLVLESPVIQSEGSWNELVVSWNVEPAAGAGLEVEARARIGERWTRGYRLGSWSLDGERPVRRTSFGGESDADGRVKTDTLVMRRASDGVRLRLHLVGTLAESPEHLRWVTLSLCDSERSRDPRAARSDVWGTMLDVPERSQVAYLDGRAWCSPTSVSMILGWWSRQKARPDWDRDVPVVAAGVQDPGWPGTGNWPFNTAYAGSVGGLRGCAARLRDLRDVEDLVAAGIPVVLSVNAPALRGKPVAPDGGHLVIVVGFTSTGDVTVNDPWARLDEGQRVRRVYRREFVERAWTHAHRLAYLIAPEERVKAFPAVWR